jgi:arylsulfatase A-like enzyme/L-ascorbate metabolism protein UlaG (beta-lactamase superfamily)
LRTPFRKKGSDPFSAVCAVGALAAVLALAAGTNAQTRPDRPNIVMFIMDDLGYGDTGSYGVEDAKTPNIDRLAREGVKLTDFYANGANCSPTRTGFITGRYQQRYGIEVPIATDAVGLAPSDLSLPQLLKTRGYATGLIGKWHLGSKPQYLPRRHGFDEFWGFLGGAVDFYRHGWMRPDALGRIEPAKLQSDLYHNEEHVRSSHYLTDDITSYSKQFIEQHRAEPFFLEVSYNAVHWPFQGPDLPPDKRDRVDVLHEGTRAEYVAMLERADRGVGEILDLLDRLQLANNTIAIFTSDNGGEWLSRNAPLFHRKSSLWEGGIGVPLLLRWPGHLRPGTVSRQVGITMDLTASILAAAGVKPPASYRPDGINLVPLLQSGKTIERTLFWRLNQGGKSQKVVRRGRWKYLKDGTSTTIDGNHEFLFDLETDRSERNDLAVRRPELVAELRGLVADWEAQVSEVVITPSIHSSIQLEYNGKVIQIDPWSAGNLAALKPADLILITDDVNHHLDVKAIQQLRKPGAPVVIAANGLKQVPDGIVMNNGDTREVAGVRIEATPAYDIKPGDPYHPKGEANGYIVALGGKRIYVVGVTECVPEIRAAKDIDVAFFPMNLPLARMEPAAAIECIKAFRPKVVYPYHYDQDWVTRVNRGQSRGSATTRGLQELKDGLQSVGIEVRLADWYPQ